MKLFLSFLVLPLLSLTVLVLTGCGSTLDTTEAVSTNDGKYYLDDGPPEQTEIALADIPDAVPKVEKINPVHNRPYTALGKSFTPYTRLREYRQRGFASWYGRRYHGRKTSSGEVYDMFKMTAAHPFLAIPGYVRVTRVDNGASVVVRVNDRGPFLNSRIIDLSYAAAHRLGYVKDGTAEVIVEAIIPNNTDNNNTDETSKTNVIPTTTATIIQLGAFLSKDGAEITKDRFIAEVGKIAKIKKSDNYYIVYIDAESASAAAEEKELCAIGWCGIVK